MIKNLIKKYSISCLFLYFHVVTRFIKLSLAAGSYSFFFPFSTCFMPLIGIYSGIEGLLFSGITQGFLLHTLSSKLPSILLVYHIPTFCGALYWTLLYNTRLSPQLKRFCLVLTTSLAAILFIMHPIGAQAALYTSFWIVPVITSFFPYRFIFLHSLGSTFMCHMAGSVLWLYGKNLTAQAWLSLIPQVCIERVFFALLMTASYYSIFFLIFLVKHFKKSLSSSFSIPSLQRNI